MSETPEPEKKKPAFNAPMFAVGIAIGAALGAALQNVALGIGVGVALGAGLALTGTKKPDDG